MAKKIVRGKIILPKKYGGTQSAMFRVETKRIPPKFEKVEVISIEKLGKVVS